MLNLVFGIGSLLMVLLMIILIVCIGYGYINNIVELVHCDFKPSYKAEILHSIGVIVPPVGVIMGFCDINDISDANNIQ